MHYFILGPSGAGKSYVAENFAASISALWLEVDVWPPSQKRIDELNLRPEWEALLAKGDAVPICDEFDKRAKAEGKTGVVLSLPGFPILNTNHAEGAKGRARIVYVTGTPGQCLDSFLRREKLTGRSLDVTHWCKNTGDFFSALERSEFKRLAINNFNPDGTYRALDDIFAEIVRQK